MKTIKDRWNNFRDITIPEDASANQILRAKSGFYAGAAAFMDLMLAKADYLDAGRFDKEMTELRDEIEAFADEMIKMGENE